MTGAVLVCINKMVGCFLMLKWTLTDGQPRPGAIRRKRADNTGFLLHLHRASGKRKGQIGSVELVQLDFLSFHVSWGNGNALDPIICRLVSVEVFSSLATVVFRVSFFLEMGVCISEWGACGNPGSSAVRRGHLMHLVWLERRWCSMGFYTRFGQSVLQDIPIFKRIDNNRGSNARDLYKQSVRNTCRTDVRR